LYPPGAESGSPPESVFPSTPTDRSPNRDAPIAKLYCTPRRLISDNVNNPGFHGEIKVSPGSSLFHQRPPLSHTRPHAIMPPIIHRRQPSGSNSVRHRWKIRRRPAERHHLVAGSRHVAALPLGSRRPGIIVPPDSSHTCTCALGPGDHCQSAAASRPSPARPVRMRSRLIHCLSRCQHHLRTINPINTAVGGSK